MDGQDDESFADGKLADIERQAFLDGVIAQTVPIAGTPAEAYLRSRGIDLSPEDARAAGLVAVAARRRRRRDAGNRPRTMKARFAAAS